MEFARLDWLHLLDEAGSPPLEVNWTEVWTDVLRFAEVCSAVEVSDEL